jgi:hypothetical protein
MSVDFCVMWAQCLLWSSDRRNFRLPEVSRSSQWRGYQRTPILDTKRNSCRQYALLLGSVRWADWQNLLMAGVIKREPDKLDRTRQQDKASTRTVLSPPMNSVHTNRQMELVSTSNDFLSGYKLQRKKFSDSGSDSLRGPSSLCRH